MEKKINLVKVEEVIHKRIFIIRGHRVMLDADLAELYGVVTKRFNEQVKRNKDRFPDDFMFQLTQEEKQEVVAICDHLSGLKFSHTLPYAFTEHGVTMLSAILNSPQAIQMSIFIVRAFIKMREYLENYKELALKIGEIEAQQKEDQDILYQLHGVIKHLIEQPVKTNNKIGFNKES